MSYVEDVEADEETIEDILTGLEEGFDPSATSDGEQSGAEPDTVDGDGADDESSEDEDGAAQEGLVYCHAVAFSSVVSFRLPRLAKDAWTDEEVRQIMQFLKQRGRWDAATNPNPFVLIPAQG